MSYLEALRAQNMMFWGLSDAPRPNLVNIDDAMLQLSVHVAAVASYCNLVKSWDSMVVLNGQICGLLLCGR